jgi:predicted nucleotidyltransferase
MNTDWVEKNTILKCLAGSKAYGTNIESSDTDIRGICIPPSSYVLGSAFKFEQMECKGDDTVVYGIQKFVRLATDANPNILEFLFVDSHLFLDKYGEQLVAARDLFLSKKAKHTYSGYAVAQLKKIESHRRWLLTPPSHEPTRAEFNLPEMRIATEDQYGAINALIKEKLDGWEIDTEILDEADKIRFNEKFESVLTDIAVTKEMLPEMAAKAIGMDQNFIQLVVQEKKYRTKLIEWKQYQNWLETRNPTRAALEKKYGFDTKHGMHLVRLMRMCKEILAEGKLLVKRPDAEELLSIRNGAWTYAQLMEWAEKQKVELDQLYKTSTLRASPDVHAINALCQEIMKEFYKEEK